MAPSVVVFFCYGFNSIQYSNWNERKPTGGNTNDTLPQQAILEKLNVSVDLQCQSFSMVDL